MTSAQRLTFLSGGDVKDLAKRLKEAIFFSTDRYDRHRTVLPELGRLRCPVYMSRSSLHKEVVENLDMLDNRINRYMGFLDTIFESAAMTIRGIMKHDDSVGDEFKTREIEGVVNAIQSSFGLA